MQGSKVSFSANFALTSVGTSSLIMFRSRSACEIQPAVLQEAHTSFSGQSGKFKTVIKIIIFRTIRTD